MADRGRPKSDTAKRHETRIRMSDEELQRLEYCAVKTGKTKAEIVRMGVNKIYHELKEGE